MTEPVKRCALVGTGPRAAVLARAMVGHPDLELVAACDPDPAALHRWGTRFPGVATFDSLAGMAEGARPDFAVVATPPARHAEDLLALLDRGIPALAECPMVESEEQALAVYAAAQRTGTPVALGESFCYLPSVQAMAGLLAGRRAAGRRDAVLSGEGHYLEMDVGLPAGGWRDTYAMARYITHSLGPLLYVTGQRARRVIGLDPLGRRARIQGPLQPTALVETDGGAVFYVASSGLTARPLTRWTVTTEFWSAESDPASVFDGPLRVFESDGDPAARWEQQPVVPQQVYGDLWGLGKSPERLMLRRFAAALDGTPFDIDLATSLNMSLAGVAAATSGRGGGVPVEVLFS